MERIRVAECFSGYGSQRMALERLKRDFGFDYEVVMISEIDKNALRAYEAVHGDCPNYGDISKIDWNEVPDFDLMTYSFPCTDISNAGRQAGLSDGSGTRSSLLWECRNAIYIKRPKYLLMENVKALVSGKFIDDFAKWGRWLYELGYSNYWRVLNAKDYGVPQNRERVFMVSILRTEDDPNPTYEFPKGFDLDRCVEDCMVQPDDVSDGYFIDQERITNSILSDILDQPNVRAELEELYHNEWKERISE